MTCIIGLVQDGEVWMAADGRANFEYMHRPCVRPKIARIGPMLIGLSGMPRVLLLASNASSVPPRQEEQDAFDWLCTDFAGFLRAVLQDHRALPEEDGLPSIKSHLLIALEGRLFLMDGSFVPFEASVGFESIGSGAEVAMGYMIATPERPPRERLLGALEAAASMIPTVGPPFHIEKL